jgi:hypothetical protein
MNYKLGLRPLVHPIKLRLKDYVNLSVLPAVPPRIDWSLGMTSGWSMLGNGPDPDNPPGVNGVGDCFFAAATELIRVTTANAQTAQAALGTSDTLKAYGLCTGWDAKNPHYDPGTEPGQGFNFLCNTGIAGHKFGPIVEIDRKNEDLVRAGMALFPGLMMGVDFPADWENAPLWDVTTSPIEGGHEIYLFAYDNADPKVLGRLATWGMERLISWAAAPKFINQLTATIPPEWIADNNLAPSGFDLEALLADEQALSA